MVKRLLLAAQLALAVPTAWSLESVLLDKVTALPVEYRLVQGCGHWEAGGGSGHVRVVVGDVHDGAGSEAIPPQPAASTCPASLSTPSR